MIVISPHLDDAVFSCGALLATVRRATVVTICAGVPPKGTPPSNFDEAAGFESGDEAALARRAEDRAAAELLGIDIVHLDCLPDEYDRLLTRRGRARQHPERQAKLTAATREVLRAHDGLILAPLGLRHPDHELIARACHGHCAFYEELPYRVLWPEFTAPALRRAGRTIQLVGLSFICDQEASEMKAAAINCYPSQLIGMDTTALLGDEVYHRVQP